MTLDWHHWLARWDAQQTGYLPDREDRFAAMATVLAQLLPPEFVVLDLCCGPGSLSQRVLTHFPQARAVAVDLDPVLLALGQGALGTMDGRLRWVEVIGHGPEVIRYRWRMTGEGRFLCGAPEDLVLNGAFDATFAGAALKSDREFGGLYPTVGHESDLHDNRTTLLYQSVV